MKELTKEQIKEMNNFKEEIISEFAKTIQEFAKKNNLNFSSIKAIFGIYQGNIELNTTWAQRNMGEQRK